MSAPPTEIAAATMGEPAAESLPGTTATMPDVPTLDEYWETLRPHLKIFSAEDQRAAIALYRELARGEPVDEAQLGRVLGISAKESRALLERDSIKSFVYPDRQGRILGFGGLALAPMHHRFEVDGRTLATWCAWDSLFIPEILGRSARVESADPVSGELVRLTVAPERIESVEPSEPVLSFVRPDAQIFAGSAANVMAKFCHYIFYFASRSSGERWIAKNPGAFLYCLEDAFSLGKRLNASNFGLELARRSTSLPGSSSDPRFPAPNFPRP